MAYPAVAGESGVRDLRIDGIVLTRHSRDRLLQGAALIAAAAAA